MFNRKGGKVKMDRFELVARTVWSIINSHAQENNDLLMFRLTDMEERVYKSFLDIIAKEPLVTTRELVVRTATPIEGYENFTVEENKTLTHYRNHLRSSEIFISIENEKTSDAQSLQNIHPISEYELCNKYIDRMVSYIVEILREEVPEFEKGLTDNPKKKIRDFLKVVNDMMPLQLKLTSGFLVNLIDSVQQNYTKDLYWNIGNVLNHLQFFRDPEGLSSEGDSEKKLKILLEKNRGIVLLRNSIPKEAERKKWEEKINNYLFMHTVPDYLDEKINDCRDIIKNFLVTSKTHSLGPALRIDFQDIKGIFGEKKVGILQRTHQEIIIELEKAFGPEETEEKIKAHQDVLEELKENLKPSEEQLERFVKDLEPSLPSKVINKVRKLYRPTSNEVQCKDFIYGLYSSIIKLMEEVEVNNDTVIKINVKYIKAENRKEKISSTYARSMFKFLYGGITNYFNKNFQWNWPSEKEIELDGLEDSDQTENMVWIEIELINSEEEINQLLLIWEAPSSNSWLSTTFSAAKSILQYDCSKFMRFIVESQRNNQLPTRVIPNWASYGQSKDFEDIINKQYPDFDSDLQSQIISVMGDTASLYRSILEESLNAGMLSVDLDKLNEKISLLFYLVSSISGNNEREYYTKRLFYWMTVSDENINYVIYPLLHPIKWNWHLNRVKYWVGYINEILLMFQDSNRNDQKLLHPKEETITSYGFPTMSVIMKDSIPKVAVSVYEESGYEIFSSESMILERTSQIGDQEITKIYDEYFSIYPFARNGLNVSIIYPSVEVAKKLYSTTYDYIKVQSQKRKPRINITFYVRERANHIFDAIESLNYEAFEDENQLSPLLSVRIDSTSIENITDQTALFENQDIVIWVDLIGSLSYEAKKVDKNNLILDSSRSTSYLKSISALVKPFHSGNDYREFQLNDYSEIDILQSYHQVGASLYNGMTFNKQDRVVWEAKATMGTRKRILSQLHRHFNWVCILDSHVDLQMIEQLFETGEISIIHFMPFHQFKGKRHLTISSSAKSQLAIQRKITQKLRRILQDNEPRIHQIAAAIVRETRKISSDALIKSLGPNYFINELIGILAIHQVHEENSNIELDQDSISFWLRLDDYKHWFSEGKRPDLAYFKVIVDTHNRQMDVEIDLVEIKVISESKAKQEIEDAQRQLISGHSVITGMWGNPDLSNYRELYEAIIHHVNIRAGSDQQHIIETWIPFILLESKSNLNIRTRGYVYAFKHDDINPEITPHISSIMTVKGSEHISDDWYQCYEYSSMGLKHLMKRYTEKMLLQVERDAWNNEISESNFRTILDNIEDYKEGLEEAPLKDMALNETNLISENPNPELKKEQSIEIIKEGDATFSVNKVEFTETDISSGMDVKNNSLIQLNSGVEINQEIFNILEAMAVADTEKVREQEEAEQAQKDVLTFYRKVGISGLTAGAILVGPRVIRIKINKPTTVTMKNLEKYSTDLKLHLKAAETPSIQAGNDGMVWIDIARKNPRLVPLIESLQGLSHYVDDKYIDPRFPLGISVDGKWEYGDFSKNSSWLVGGSAGSGKSVFIRSLLLHMMLVNSPEQLQLYIIDPKGDLFQLREAPHVKGIVTATSENLIEESVQLLKDVEQEMHQRKREMLTDFSLNELKDVNAQAQRAVFPRTVLVIEEFGSLTMGANDFKKDILASITQIAQFGRAMGFHVIVATQNPTTTVVPTELKANLNGRVALYVVQDNNSEVILDEFGAEKLFKNGDLLVKTDGPTQRLQSPFINQSTTSELIGILKSIYGKQNSNPKLIV